MDILADDERVLNADDPRYKPKPDQRGTLADVALGIGAGVAMGTVEVATAPDALLRGDKKAAALRAQDLSIFKPDDLGSAGEFTYGLTKDFTRIGWNALATLGTGGTVGLGLQASAFGGQSYESEKADLLNKGADVGTARVGGAIKGVTDAAGFALPVHGVSTNKVVDAVATTGLATAGGVVGDYVEGDYLKGDQNKNVSQHGEQLKENAVSPATLGANGGMALLLNLWANKGRLRPDQVAQHEQNDASTDSAHIQANIEHAEQANPFHAEQAKDANSHFNALDSSMEQALNDERVTLQAPVTGRAKAPVALLTPSTVHIDPSEFASIKYNDPRLDIISDNTALKMNMAWASPLIKAIRKSGEKSNNSAVSPQGAKSVMQFIPSTFNGLKKKYNKGWDINNPSDMTEAAYYLVRDISKEYKTQDPRVIAAHYNGGYKNGKAVQRTGNAVSGETKAYIDRITKGLDGETAPILRGSESEFPQFEADNSKPPEYTSQSEAEVSALPNVMRHPEDASDLEADFERLQSSITQEDLDYIRDTAHYQPIDGNVNRVPYVDPQPVNLSGNGRSAQTQLAQLEESTQQVQTQAEASQSTIGATRSEVINSPDNQIPPVIGANNAQMDVVRGLDDWKGTRSDNYLKRSMAQDDGSTIQQLHNQALNTTFERQINADGTVSPVRAMKNGTDYFARAKENEALTKTQNDATQALEREFWQSKTEQGAPDLLSTQQGKYGSFDATAEGREALDVMEANPDMQITYSRLDENGNEETVTASAKDLLDHLQDQEELAKEDIKAVKALASCALKFGSDAV